MVSTVPSIRFRSYWPAKRELLVAGVRVAGLCAFSVGDQNHRLDGRRDDRSRIPARRDIADQAVGSRVHDAEGVEVAERDIQPGLVRGQAETRRGDARQTMCAGRRKQDRAGDRVVRRVDDRYRLAVGVGDIQLGLGFIQQQRDRMLPGGEVVMSCGLAGSSS